MASISRDLKNFKFESNPLNTEFDTFSYHFTWFMTPLSDISNFQKDCSKKHLTNKMIIAESGVTSSFSIKSIEIESLVGANFKSRNVTATNIVMELKETYGLTLFDRLIKAAAVVRAPSIYETPMFLSLGFTGYDSDGTTKNINDMFVWYVKLVDVKPTTDISGTVYSIRLIPMADVAHRPETFQLRETTELKNIRNVNDFLRILEQEMNKSEEKFRGYVKALGMLSDLENKYFGLSVEPGTKIAGKNFGDLVFRSGKSSESAGNDDGTFNFKLEKGWTISRIIDAMYANLEDFKKGVSIGANTSDDRYRVTEIPRIITETLYGKFLPDTQEFGKRINFIIRPFTVARIQEAKPQTDTFRLAESTRTLKILETYNLMKKRYDYVFSGNNTEVISADMNLNALWAVSFSLSPAMLSYRTDDRRSRKLPNNLATVKIEEEELKNLSVAQLYQVRQSINDTISGLEKEDKREANTVGNTRLLDKEIKEREKSLIATVREPEEVQFRQGRLLLESTGPGNLEDEFSSLGIKTRYELVTDPPMERYTINAVQPDIGVQKRATVLEQAYDKRALIELEMTIKGDPYWLGPTSKETADMKKNNNYGLTLNAPYNVGECSFYFEYFSPVGINEESGLMEIDQSTVLRGVYSVYKVKHTFDNGKFTQSFKAFKNNNVVVR